MPWVFLCALQDGKEKQAVPPLQLNVIHLLAELYVSVNKPKVVDMILPLFIESLEEGDASTPGILRLRVCCYLMNAYYFALFLLLIFLTMTYAVVLMTRSYLGKLSNVGSAESRTQVPEATTEHVEVFVDFSLYHLLALFSGEDFDITNRCSLVQLHSTLPAGFLLIAKGITSNKLRSGYCQRFLSQGSDVGLATESKSGRSGADFLGPLLPAVAEICSDFEPSVDVEPSLLKLIRNLWFYIGLFGLAPPIQKTQTTTKSVSTTLNSVGSMGTTALQAVGGPYMWNSSWSSAVQCISQGTPPLINIFLTVEIGFYSVNHVECSVKWLEDELELNALHNPGSRRGSGNEKAVVNQRTALSAALGGRVEVSAMSTISVVKASYLLAVAFLEIIRFSSNGGILNGGPNSTASRNAFNCVFEYLRSPNLMPADDRASGSGPEAEILWNSSCLDSLLLSMHNDPPSAVVSDPAYVASVRSLYQKIVREWIIVSLSHAPCTTQGLLRENLCKANTWQRTQPTADVVSLLSEIRIVSAAPKLGSLVLAELVDAWLWTIDTKRGIRCSGPSAKLRPRLAPGEPESQPTKDPVEQIMAYMHTACIKASLGWFAHQPEWYDMNNNNFAQSVSVFVNHLLNNRLDATQLDQRSCLSDVLRNNSYVLQKDQCHPIWGQMENYAVGREKRRQLLLMVCHHEADRLEVLGIPYTL
ncbi:hypothetical protein BUALT_Bualt13G0113900 [Buddleja alternifolia]|uniref:PI4-kinase N-terminal domain-containing protein n=1 Tax=Buddleja alternifolia TaxID=168488 RepID=A0AAV6WLY0_9LAMI|nr:hypothetical protein BUALT_Bualt13G0113900 [Buddleja alternifolia]